LNNNKRFTLPHEVGHALTNMGHYGTDYQNNSPIHVINQNLMRRGTSQGNSLTGSKRWKKIQVDFFQQNLLKNP